MYWIRVELMSALRFAPAKKKAKVAVWKAFQSPSKPRVFADSNPRSPQMPSSIPTCLHQGVSVGFSVVCASPTCLLALTSLPLALSPVPLPERLFSFIAMLESVKLGISLCCLPTLVNPWDEREVIIPNDPALLPLRLCEDPFIHSSLMTGRCHWSGSELDDNLLRCR